MLYGACCAVQGYSTVLRRIVIRADEEKE
jgi:hypothetical protein